MNKTIDTGNLLLHGNLTRGLFSLAGPMLIAAILQNAQSLIDLFWIGRLGSSAVAALAMSGTILMLMFPVVVAMSAGTVATVSRHVGAGRRADAEDVAGQSMLLALVVGLIAGVVGWALTDKVCLLLGATGDVLRYGSDYLGIAFLGTFTMTLLFIGNSILQASGNAVVPMCAMVLSNLLNIVLAPVFIFGLLGCPRMEARGAALAMVIAQAVAALIVMLVLSSGRIGIHVRLRHWRLIPRIAWQVLRIGIPSCGQMLTRSLMSLVLMRIVAFYGTAALAAYGIGLRFHMILLLPAFALGNSVSTMVGQNLGARQPGRAQAAAWLAVGIDVAIMAGSALLLMVFARPLVRVFDSNPAVVVIGVDYLRIVSPFFVFAGVGILFGRALEGAADTLAPMIITIISLWGLQIPLAVALSRITHPPTHGIWWAISAAMMLHGLMVCGWFLTGRWKHKRI